MIVEPDGERLFDPCACCGGMTRSVWGYVYEPQQPWAAYFVRWTVGAVEAHGAAWKLILPLGETRGTVAIRYSVIGNEPQFMVVDAEESDAGVGTTSDRALKRTDVIGHPLASRVFQIIDRIWLADLRLEELRNSDRRL